MECSLGGGGGGVPLCGKRRGRVSLGGGCTCGKTFLTILYQMSHWSPFHILDYGKPDDILQ